jgi:hypothetical protein
LLEGIDQSISLSRSAIASSSLSEDFQNRITRYPSLLPVGFFIKHDPPVAGTDKTGKRRRGTDIVLGYAAGTDGFGGDRQQTPSCSFKIMVGRQPISRYVRAFARKENQMGDPAVPLMWYENLLGDKSWSALWNDYTICGECRGIRRFQGPCQICGDPPFRMESQLVRDATGREFRVPVTFMGAEGRYEDWVYLRMMEREWKRPVLDEDRFPGLSASAGPSPRASIVILFWSYFETRIERLLRSGLPEIPTRVLDDMLRRYSAIGARLNDLYSVAFSSTYKKDLEEVGHGQIWPHLALVQERRNQFAHGQPQAIDDALVQKVVEKLKDEHEAWIAVFNKRATRKT